MLSIILPTYNEAENLPELMERIAGVLKSIEHEVIVVDDDSPDGTWKTAESLVKKYKSLRVIRRVDRRGLSSAVVEGFDAAKGDVLLVMDSDLQHDPALIAQLCEAVKKGAGIAVASRYMKGGSVGEWVSGRKILSAVGTWLARRIIPVRVSDPMSGFFALNADVYRRVRGSLRPTGFKILFEILAHLPSRTSTIDVPLVFRMRAHGASKLSAAVQILFLLQLLRLALARLQHVIFWLLCSLIAVLLLSKALPLLPLYTDDGMRSNVQEMLTSLSESQGWLMSDLALRSVDTDGIEVVYRAHHRGPDEVSCYRVLFDSLDPIPCAD